MPVRSQAKGQPEGRSPAARVPQGGGERTEFAAPSFCVESDRCAAIGLAGLAAALLGLAACLVAGGAAAGEPLKLADSALEPVKWSDLEGWTADDHLAAFGTYQTSCQALR